MVRPSFMDGQGRLLPGAPAVAALERLIAHHGDPRGLLAALRANDVAPEGAQLLVEAGAPQLAASAEWGEALHRNREKGRRLREAAVHTGAALAGLEGRIALPGSSLGPAWSSDVDVLLAAGTLGEAEDLLRDAGFLDLNPLLARLGRTTADVRRFGALAGSEVLGSVELCLRLHDAGPPADEAVARALPSPDGGLPRLTAHDRLVRRCAKIAARRRPILRDALELAALQEELGVLPEMGDVALALRRTRELEASWAADRPAGARGPVRPDEGRRYALPSAAWVAARGRGVRRELRRALRPRRLHVAVTGIDGAGKSTQARLLVANLLRLSVPADAVWNRIGFSGSALLSRAAHLGQRLLPAGSHSAQTARATGAAAPGRPPLTRRGAVGWSWALALTLDHVRLARRAARSGRGAVTVFDRALPDALVELDEGYGGALDLRVHRALARRLLPRADLTVYLRLSGAEAHARKADLFTPEVLDGYARRYDAMLADFAPVVVDANRPADEIALRLLRRIADGGSAP